MPSANYLWDSPKGRKRQVVLALTHGAGAPMDSAFLQTVTAALVARGITVMRFEFTYMAARRSGQGRRPPSKMPVLCQEFKQAVLWARKKAPQVALFIGGKSMGGRVASMLTDELQTSSSVRGCLCFGYPFHPPKKSANLRTAHLLEIRCPTLILQGERDPLGNTALVAGLDLPKAISLAWLPDGDHDFAPRVSSGLTQQLNIESAVEKAAQFMLSHAA